MNRYTDDDLIAELLRLVADVRRETREATIRECANVAMELDQAAGSAVFALLPPDHPALARPPSAPAEPKCRVCGAAWDAPFHSAVASKHGGGHNFEPEEPGT